MALHQQRLLASARDQHRRLPGPGLRLPPVRRGLHRRARHRQGDVPGALRRRRPAKGTGARGPEHGCRDGGRAAPPSSATARTAIAENTLKLEEKVDRWRAEALAAWRKLDAGKRGGTGGPEGDRPQPDPDGARSPAAIRPLRPERDEVRSDAAAARPGALPRPALDRPQLSRRAVLPHRHPPRRRSEQVHRVLDQHRVQPGAGGGEERAAPGTRPTSSQGLALGLRKLGLGGPHHRRGDPRLGDGVSATRTTCSSWRSAWRCAASACSR